MSEEEDDYTMGGLGPRATRPRSRHSTVQDVLTPDDLREAVIRRFGPIVFDLAAADGHEIIPLCQHFTPEQNALEAEWPTARCPLGVLWLNPPYSPDIEPWACKAAEWRLRGVPGSCLAMLVPASIDADWWRLFVRGKAHVIALKSRPKFKGHSQGYPKPMVLCVYDPRYPDQGSGVELWDWKGTMRCSCDAIRSHDPSRHFKGCPARKEMPRG